jgi:hypothetical protein
VVDPASHPISRVGWYSRWRITRRGPPSPTGLSPPPVGRSSAVRLKGRVPASGRYPAPSASSYPRTAARTGSYAARVWAPPVSLAATPGILSSPRGTEMFQFPRCPHRHTPVSRRFRRWVAPFGDPWITRCQHVPRAFRGVAASFIGSRRLGIHHALIFVDHPIRCPVCPYAAPAETPLPPGKRRGSRAAVPPATMSATGPLFLRITPDLPCQTCSCGVAGIRTPDLRRAKAALSQLSYDPLPGPARLVGAPGLEPGTSVLSGPRSNHLSYAPRRQGRALRRRRSAALVRKTIDPFPAAVVSVRIWLETSSTGHAASRQRLTTDRLTTPGHP